MRSFSFRFIQGSQNSRKRASKCNIRESSQCREVEESSEEESRLSRKGLCKKSNFLPRRAIGSCGKLNTLTLGTVENNFLFAIIKILTLKNKKTRELRHVRRQIMIMRLPIYQIRIWSDFELRLWVGFRVRILSWILELRFSSQDETKSPKQANLQDFHHLAY